MEEAGTIFWPPAVTFGACEKLSPLEKARSLARANWYIKSEPKKMRQIQKLTISKKSAIFVLFS